VTVRILQGDCRDVLKTLPDESVHCVVTSPPYWGLRDYEHDGQIGLEPTLGEYVERMTTVFCEVRRVLRDDGTCWLNLGDSYIGGGRGGGSEDCKQRTNVGSLIKAPKWSGAELKAKDLAGIPWRVAFALQEAGWWLRSDIIWSKPNPMPESITDRPTKSHEYLFLLAKAERYHYDYKAILEPLLSGPSDLKKMAEQQERIGGKHKDLDDPLAKASGTTNIGRKRSVGSKQAAMAALDARGHRYASLAQAADDSEDGTLTGRNRRSVWNVATAPYSGAHFATFPPALIEPCILAGCPEGGTVLDPFGGAGTTGLVADRLGRDAILIEINQEYAAMAESRINLDAKLFADVQRA
jgi:DNA modification methylase